MKMRLSRIPLQHIERFVLAGRWECAIDEL